jgi:hypothetical protein
VSGSKGWDRGVESGIHTFPSGRAIEGATIENPNSRRLGLEYARWAATVVPVRLATETADTDHHVNSISHCTLKNEPSRSSGRYSFYSTVLCNLVPLT